jgi:GAF domain-containing protein
MVTNLKNILRTPVFDNLEMTATARRVHTILFCTIALTILFLIYTIFFPHSGQVIIAIVTLVLEFVSLIFIQFRRIRLASLIFTSMLWIAILVDVALYGGIRDTGFGAFATIILIAGLTMGIRASILFTLITLLAGLGLTFAENLGLLPAYFSVPISSVLLSQSINLIAIALLLNLAIRNITTMSRKIIVNEKSEQETKKKLEASQTELNQRTITLEKRNNSIQIIATLSRLATKMKTEQEFLEQSTKVLIEMNLTEQVGFYLLDQIEEYAILQVFRDQAGSVQPTSRDALRVLRSESSSLPMGTEMLQIKVGNKNYFIDVPKKSPEIKAHLFYPLVSADKLMGLMNIQTSSTDHQDIENQPFQLLADQIAISVMNIRLRNQLQSHVQDVGELAGNAIQSAWDQLGEERNIGYAYDRVQVLPTNETFPQDVAEILRSGKATSFVGTGTPPLSRLAAPIILRDAIIGVIGYESNIIDHEWQEEEKALLETVAARVSLALENARLFEETTRRADRERTVSEITTRIRSVSDPQVMVQTALEELKRALGANNIQIRPYSPKPVLQTNAHQHDMNRQKPSQSAEVS